jgi:hypothetical protein
MIGLGVVTYLIKRYLSNTTATTNGYYVKPDSSRMSNEPSGNILVNLAAQEKDNSEKGIVYIFWNGDMKSTYLLIDQLLQDKIIQPLYVERYTIFKTLEHEQLEKYTKLYNTNRKACTTSVLEYLTGVAKLKRQQSKETNQIEILRNAICNQYAEFKMNILPTRFITTIAKDLSYSQEFYDIINSIMQKSELTTCQINGIEFYEQASRYIKHSQLSINSKLSRVILGYSKESHLMEIIKKINANTNPAFNRIEMPLKYIDNESIRYLAVEISPVVMTLLPKSKD